MRFWLATPFVFLALGCYYAGFGFYKLAVFINGGVPDLVDS